MPLSLPALTAVGAGSLFLYGAVTGKSVTQAALAIVKGNSPTTAASTPNIPGVNVDNVAGATASTITSPTGGTLSESDTVNALIASFTAHGVSKAQMAGALGNIQEESGFSSTAGNAKEGAIGLCQWELGRRTNLQNFAKSMGTTETDANAQIAFMWHELLGVDLGAYTAWRATTTPTAAAAVWDALYERSSGSTRQQRETYAQQWYGVL